MERGKIFLMVTTIVFWTCQKKIGLKVCQLRMVDCLFNVHPQDYSFLDFSIEEWVEPCQLTMIECLFTLEAIACFKIKLIKILLLLPRVRRRDPWLWNILSYLLPSLVVRCQTTSSSWSLFRCGWKHTMVSPLGVSHCTSFQRCACWNVFQFKLSKEFHNIFAYYVRI